MSLVSYRPRRYATPSVFNEDAVRSFFNAEWPDARRDTPFVPAVNVHETDNAFTLTFAVPGRKKEDLRVNVDRNILTVSYSEDKDKNQTDGKVHLREFVRKSFSRSFQLPETVNAEAINAAYTDGLLTLTLPKNEAATPLVREIAIA
jgi:HSP20 family protein